MKWQDLFGWSPENSKTYVSSGTSSSSLSDNLTAKELLAKQQGAINQMGSGWKEPGPFGLAQAQAYDDLLRNYGNASKIPNPNSYPLWTLKMSNLDDAAGRASLQELADLWRTRWGSTWVKRGEIEGDFYNIAAARLSSGYYLETHQLQDGTLVYRLLR